MSTFGPPRKITDEKFVNLYAVSRESNGKSSDWIFASRKSSAHAGTVTPDAVVIAAVVTTSDGPKLIITREYRAPIGCHELSLPSGLVDPGEAVAEAAARELREETGLTLKKIFHVSPPVASSAGLTDEAVCILYGEATGETSRSYLTEHEDIDTKFFSIDDIRALLRSPAGDTISSRLYPMLVGFVTSGSFQFPKLD